MTQSPKDRAIHASYSSKIPFNKENVAKVPDISGSYKFFNQNGKLLYIGVTHDGEFSGMRHRLQSYYQVDDFDEHPTKRWRTRIKTFSYKKNGIHSARKEEQKIKQGATFNADNVAHDLHR